MSATTEGHGSTLDAAALLQAMQVLGREEPTLWQQGWFEALNFSSWAALLLTVLWPFAAAFTDIQKPVLMTAFAVYAVIGICIFANLALFAKLRRAAQAERAFALGITVGALTLADTAWHRQLPGRIRHGLGYVLMPIGALGLSTVARTDDWITPAVGGALFALGVACLFLYPMERGRRRLAEIAQLRESLMKACGALAEGPVELDPSVHDRFKHVEDVQICAARLESLEADQEADAPAVLMSDEFCAAVSGLPETTSIAVFDFIDTLLARTSELENRGNCWQSVPPTSLAIEVRFETSKSELILLSIRDDCR